MSRIKIETLTSVHIGSGVTLLEGNDFVCGKYDGDDVIAVVSPEKVLQLIGEENLNAWVSAIERGTSIDAIVRQFSPKAQLEDYARRMIMRWCNKTSTLKEFIHDGMGMPYIPGSSIKGAVRTAVLATVAEDISNKEYKLTRNGRNYNANMVEAEAFGSDPNKSVFRFLQVGDARFSDDWSVAAVRMVNLNERNHKSYWDKDKPQMVEVLMSEQHTFFDMKIDLDYYELCHSKGNVHTLPSCMVSLPKLFEAINVHTLSLLNSEIEYWEERIDDANADNVDVYIEKIEKMKDETEKCLKTDGRSCVLRIGHGSGWRFVTGAWTEKLSNFQDVVKASRPRNDRYTQYDFPKSRRVDDECELLGFVKLSM